MFSFDNGMLFVQSSKNAVTKLRNLANLEKDIEGATFSCVEVTNAAGTHLGVGFVCNGHPTVLYFEEDKSAEPPAPVPAAVVVEEEKTNEQAS